MEIIFNEQGFFEFQNEIIQEIYTTLSQSYSTDDDEIKIVTKMVSDLNGKKYDSQNHQIRLSAGKIHGKTSTVKFNYRANQIRKELGDMVVISLITSGRTRLLQRICIIQNKKAYKNTWRIDREQLFLLKNFPPFTGEQEIFRFIRRSKDIIFQNRSGCLGAYGLFIEPGEMKFISAPLMEGFLMGKGTLSPYEIGFPPSFQQTLNSNQSLGFFWYSILHIHPAIDEIFYHLRKRGQNQYDFLGNFRFGHDIYDFIRAWTQINIGEITFADGHVVNQDADAFANTLIRRTNLDKGIEIPKDGNDNNYNEMKIDGNMAVFLFHVNIGEIKE